MVEYSNGNFTGLLSHSQFLYMSVCVCRKSCDCHVNRGVAILTLRAVHTKDASLLVNYGRKTY